MRVTKDPEERRNEIIAVATDLFLHEGYEKTTVDEITRKMGVAKGTFYYYFGSKEDVFQACIMQRTNKAIDEMKDILTRKGPTAKERFAEYLDYSFSIFESRNANAMIQLVQSGSDPLISLHERVLEEGLRRVTPWITRVIEEGVENGEFSTPDAHLTAVAILGALKRIHTTDYENLSKNLSKQRTYVFDLMGRILKTRFEE